MITLHDTVYTYTTRPLWTPTRDTCFGYGARSSRKAISDRQPGRQAARRVCRMIDTITGGESSPRITPSSPLPFLHCFFSPPRLKGSAAQLKAIACWRTQPVAVCRLQGANETQKKKTHAHTHAHTRGCWNAQTPNIYTVGLF